MLTILYNVASRMLALLYYEIKKNKLLVQSLDVCYMLNKIHKSINERLRPESQFPSWPETKAFRILINTLDEQVQKSMTHIIRPISSYYSVSPAGSLHHQKAQNHLVYAGGATRASVRVQLQRGQKHKSDFHPAGFIWNPLILSFFLYTCGTFTSHLI